MAETTGTGQADPTPEVVVYRISVYRKYPKCQQALLHCRNVSQYRTFSQSNFFCNILLRYEGLGIFIYIKIALYLYLKP